jgi:hypothetical protein
LKFLRGDSFMTYRGRHVPIDSAKEDPGIYRGPITVREINVGKAAFAMITRNRFNVHRHCRDLL